MLVYITDLFRPKEQMYIMIDTTRSFTGIKYRANTTLGEKLFWAKNYATRIFPQFPLKLKYPPPPSHPQSNREPM